jgi:hypothetical protein
MQIEEGEEDEKSRHYIIPIENQSFKPFIPQQRHEHINRDKND